MSELKIAKENVNCVFDGRFVRVMDLQYKPGKHYYDATRRTVEDLVATKSEEEFLTMLPDAVTIFLILNIKGVGELLLLSYEYRYPEGRFLLSPPAGLMDPEDKDCAQPLFETAKREIKEETGITVKETDRLIVVNPCSFSTPGMSDESNALVAAIVDVDDLSELDQTGAVGSEMFNGFELVDKLMARKIATEGRDKNGRFYSLYTYAALMYYLSDMWKEE